MSYITALVSAMLGKPDSASNTLPQPTEPLPAVVGHDKGDHFANLATDASGTPEFNDPFQRSGAIASRPTHLAGSQQKRSTS